MSAPYSGTTPPLVFAGWLAVVMSAVAAMMLYYARAPLGGPPADVFALAVSLLAAAVFSWHLAVSAADRCTEPVRALAGLTAVGGVLALPLLAAAVPAATRVLAVALPALCLIGMWRTASVVRQWQPWHVALCGLTGTVLGVAAFFIVNTKGYANVYSPELALLGAQHRDTIYHAAVASMIGSFGSVSVGLDGVLPLSYHAASHAWFGALGRWLSVSPLHAYYIGPQIIGLPLLLFTASAAALALRPAPTGCDAPTTTAMVALPALAVLAVTSVVDITDFSSHLASESYLLSLCILLLAIPAMREAIVPQAPSVALLRAAMLVLVGGVLTQVKISVGIVWFAGLLALYARDPALLGVLSVKRLAALAALGGVVLLPAGIAFSGQPLGQLIQPLHFFTTYPAVGRVNLVVMLAGAVIMAWRWRRRDAAQQRIDSAVLAMMAASLVPALLLFVDGGSAYYFLNVGCWVAMAYIAGAAAVAIARFAERPVAALSGDDRSVRSLRFDWAALSAVALLATTVVATLLTDQKASSRIAMDRLVDRVVPTNKDSLDWRLDHSGNARAAVEQSLGARIERTLARTGVMGARDTLVFVEPGFTAFWSMSKVCVIPPYFIPAALQLPMLRGLPPVATACELGPFLGHQAYGSDARSTQSTDTELCERSIRRGFAKVLVLSDPDTGRLVSCR